MHGTGGATCRVVLFVLVAIAAADRELDDLSALVKAQGRLLEQMQQQLQSQAAAIEALELAAQQARAQGVKEDELRSEPGRPGRRLSAPASQRKTWHHSIVHSFDDPSSCGLNAELNSDQTGPLDITRTSEGNVSMGYGGAVSATQPAAFELNHPANCRTATLTSNHPLVVSGDLTVDGPLTLGGSTVYSSPKRLFRFDHPPAASENTFTHTGGNGTTWSDVVGMTHTLNLTETNNLLLVHYQFSFGAPAATTSSFLACRLMVGGTEQTSARSINGNGLYGSPQGTWIGELGAGSPEIKVQCRSDLTTISFHDDYMTRALTVAVLG